MMNPVSDQQLLALREFLIPRWEAWGRERGKVVTERGEGMCRFTAAFLQQALGRGWAFTGGYPDFYHPERGWIQSPAGGGYWTGSTWEAHHWVTNGRVIVDLTASQFGDAPILVVAADDPRFKSTLLPFQVREALRDVRDRAKLWLAEWVAHGDSCDAEPRPRPRLQ